MRVGGTVAEHGRASLAFDLALLRSHALPWSLRWRFLAAKYGALPRLLSGRSAVLGFGRFRFSVGTVSDLGTLQSAIVDVHDSVVATRVLPEYPPPVVVDVGANIGQFAAGILSGFPQARLTCFEPDPDTCATLRGNVARHGVDVRCAAASSSNGRATLFRQELSTLSTLRDVGQASATDERVTVDTTCLDDALTHLDRIDLLKVDVEGTELDVLRGAVGVMGRTRLLLVELSLSRDPGGENLELLRLVKDTCPEATIVRACRPLGPRALPTCQDVLIRLR
jgi:FkbM family methyltransferase